MTDKGDILVELSNVEIKELTKIYKKYKNELPHLYSFFHVCLKSKEIGMPDFVHVYSPRSCWKKDGTFIASMPVHAHDIVFHSLDPSGKNLIEGFTKTKRFKFLKDAARDFAYLYGVHDIFCSKIYKLFTEVLNHEVSYISDFYMYRLAKEKALDHDIHHFHEVYVKELSAQDLSTIVDSWSFSFSSAEQKLQDWLKFNAGFGVYLNSTNEMVSWVTASCLGQMTALQTVARHQHKGYAQLVVRKMAKYLAQKGFDCCGTVVAGNTPCERMLESLGFRKLFKCQFIGIRNKY